MTTIGVDLLGVKAAPPPLRTLAGETVDRQLTTVAKDAIRFAAAGGSGPVPDRAVDAAWKRDVSRALFDRGRAREARAVETCGDTWVLAACGADKCRSAVPWSCHRGRLCLHCARHEASERGRTLLERVERILGDYPGDLAVLHVEVAGLSFSDIGHCRRALDGLATDLTDVYFADSGGVTLRTILMVRPESIASLRAELGSLIPNATIRAAQVAELGHWYLPQAEAMTRLTVLGVVAAYERSPRHSRRFRARGLLSAAGSANWSSISMGQRQRSKSSAWLRERCCRAHDETISIVAVVNTRNEPWRRRVASSWLRGEVPTSALTIQGSCDHRGRDCAAHVLAAPWPGPKASSAVCPAGSSLCGIGRVAT